MCRQRDCNLYLIEDPEYSTLRRRLKSKIAQLMNKYVTLLSTFYTVARIVS